MKCSMAPGALSLLVLCLAARAHAQTEVFVDIGPCMAMTQDADRHACYDRLEATVRAARAMTPAADTTAIQPMPPQAPPASATPTQPAPPAVVREEPAVAAFGQESPAAARVVEGEDGEEELLDRIVSMNEREPGRWLFTLASGQHWYQTNSRRIQLREGMDVRIYPSPLGGSWRMAARNSERGFVQVRRVD